MIKLRDLQYLVALDLHRHFGKAAEACAVSQPTLSGQVLKLEQQLGIQLIERHSRKVMITNQGRVLIDKANEIINKVQDFEECAHHLLNPLNTDVHLGLVPTLAPYLLPHIMGSFNRTLNHSRFYLSEEKTDELVHKLQAGQLDCIILPKMKDFSGIDYYHLFDEELLLALAFSHPLNMQTNINLDDLKNETLLTLSDGHCLQQQTLDYCFHHDSEENTQFHATSLETLRYMVSANLGLTLMPQLAALNRCQDEGVNYVSFSDNAPHRQIVLAIRSDFHNLHLIRKMVGIIRENHKQLEIQNQWQPECVN